MSSAPGVAAGAVLADALATGGPTKAAPATSAAMGAAMGADDPVPFIGPLSVLGANASNSLASRDQLQGLIGGGPL
jgi:hypothetical protein